MKQNTCQGENDRQSAWTEAFRPRRWRELRCSQRRSVVELSTKHCWISSTNVQPLYQHLPPATANPAYTLTSTLEPSLTRLLFKAAAV